MHLTATGSSRQEKVMMRALYVFLLLALVACDSDSDSDARIADAATDGAANVDATVADASESDSGQVTDAGDAPKTPPRTMVRCL